MEEWKKKLIHGAHRVVAVYLSSWSNFILDCQSWNSRKASMCASSRSTHPPSLQHYDRFRHFPNRTEQHPWMESFISRYAEQLSCPTHISSHLSMMRWTLCTAVLSWWGVHSAGSHDTHSELQYQGSVGTQLCVLRQGWLLLSSGTW